MKAKIKPKNFNYTLALIAAVLILIAVIVFFRISKKEVSFDLKDNCGLVVNMISHTISTEEACKIKCMGQCESMDLKFSRVKFDMNMNGCNNCTCFCK